MLTTCPRCGAPLARPDGQCMICYQPSAAAESEYAPLAIWSLVLDSFRHRNYRNHRNRARDAETVPIIELDRVRDRKSESPRS